MPPPRRELIVGGRVATPYDLPFAVSIGHVNTTTNGGIAGDELARRIVPFYAIAHVHTRTRARVGARDPRAAGAAVDANLLSSCMRP